MFFAYSEVFWCIWC